MDRRKFVTRSALGLAALSPLGAAVLANAVQVGRDDDLLFPSDLCRPTFRVSQGPFMLPNSPERSDLREDRQGIALRLTVTIVDHYLCTPVENAIVDIWSTDADGLYSGVLNDQFGFTDFEPIGEPINMLDNPTFLRGHQITEADGRVEFVTIFPGWYMSRLTHVHIRALIAGQDWTAFDTQLFFPDEIQRMVYRADAYKSRGPNPVGIDRDWELRGNVAALNDLTIPLSKSSDGLVGEAILAIST